MGLLAELKFLWNPAQALASLVAQWDPGECPTEVECQRSLHRFLRSALPHLRIRELIAGGLPPDLSVQSRAVIIVHERLENSADYYRLVGRLGEYRDWHGTTLVVTTGRVAPDLHRRLEDYVGSGEGPSLEHFRVLRK